MRTRSALPGGEVGGRELMAWIIFMVGGPHAPVEAVRVAARRPSMTVRRGAICQPSVHGACRLFRASGFSPGCIAARDFPRKAVAAAPPVATPMRQPVITGVATPGVGGSGQPPAIAGDTRRSAARLPQIPAEKSARIAVSWALRTPGRIGSRGRLSILPRRRSREGRARNAIRSAPAVPLQLQRMPGTGACGKPRVIPHSRRHDEARGGDRWRWSDGVDAGGRAGAFARRRRHRGAARQPGARRRAQAACMHARSRCSISVGSRIASSRKARSCRSRASR